MHRSPRFRLFVFAVLCGLVLASVRATPVRDPRRFVNGRLVELTPLMRWWTNHHGIRPLSAWVHVTGLVVSTNAWGWVVQGQAETPVRSDDSEGQTHENHGSGKLLLRNPPVQERAEFDRLSAQLKALEAQRSQLANTQTEAKSRADALNKEQAAYRRSGYRSSRALAAETRQVNSVQNEAKAELKPLDQQLAELKRKLAVYPSTDHYEVDCFALDTSQEFQGMRLLDHGGVFP